MPEKIPLYSYNEIFLLPCRANFSLDGFTFRVQCVELCSCDAILCNYASDSISESRYTPVN